MGPSNERIDVNTSVAVRGERGFFFGTMRWVHGERLLVEVDASLDQGEYVDLRVTLGPGPGTALTRAVVQRALVTGKGEIPRYVFSVVDIAADERAALEAWLRNVKARGTFQSFDAISAATPIAEGMSGATKAETKAALERMNARSHQSNVAADPFGLRSDVKSSGSAREAMRAALRKAIAAPPEAPPAAAPPPTPPSPPPFEMGAPKHAVPPVSMPKAVPPVSVTPSRQVVPPLRATLPPGATGTRGSLPPTARAGLPPLPPEAPRSPMPVEARPPEATRPAFDPHGASRPPASAPVATPGGADPTYASTATRSTGWLEVRWSSPAVFADDVDALLRDATLVLPNLGVPLPDSAPLRVMLRHADLVLDCPGDVVEHGPFGATYRLDLDGVARRALASWRADYRKK
ncbi:MAG: hypothetical protein ACOZNI_27610 [Myxococcota bacterium]